MNELQWTQKIVDYLKKQNMNVLLDRERVLWDNTRIDILTDKFAIEVDWAHKWAEAIGQSVWYSINTNKLPAILLLVHDMKKQQKMIYRAKACCIELDIGMLLVDIQKNELIDGMSIRHNLETGLKSEELLDG